MTNSTIDATSAIKAALLQNWQEAVTLNQEILATEPENIEALNRLGLSYLKLGKYQEAKKTYQKVLTIDQYNPIAKRNLQNIQNIKSSGTPQNTTSFSPSQFIEEPGITKVVQCINPAHVTALSAVLPGQEVSLKAKNHSLEIRTTDGVYLGALPDDVAFRLSRLVHGGYEYLTSVKSIGKNTLSVFIRETKRTEAFAFQPSFVAAPLTYTSYAKAPGESQTDGQNDDDGGDMGEPPLEG